MQYNCVVSSKNNRFVVLVSVCFCVLPFSLQVASVMLITFTRWLFRARLWLLITFIASQFIFAFLKNSKLSAKLLIFFMCGGFMSSLCCFFSCLLFPLFQRWVIGFDIAERRREERKNFGGETSGGETGTENILTGLFLSLTLTVEQKKYFEIKWNLSCTCTNAACPSTATTKADTKSVGVISIALFHRKIHKIKF